MDPFTDKRSWQKKRQYLFMARASDGCVLCQDLNIAAALLCRGVEIKWNAQQNQFDVRRQFPAGAFEGIEIGRLKAENNRKVFFFKIRGDLQELSLRRNLFHAGLHWTDNNEYRLCRERLLDALTEAKESDRQKTYIPIVSGGRNEDGDGQS